MRRRTVGYHAIELSHCRSGGWANPHRIPEHSRQDLPDSILRRWRIVACFRFPAPVALREPLMSCLSNSRDGTARISLRDRMFEFLEVHLKGSQTRATPPEAHPNRRIFTNMTAVALVAASPRATIHFTTDRTGSSDGSSHYKLKPHF
jgi:hypothetical protein